MAFCPPGQTPQQKPGVVGNNIIGAGLITEGLAVLSPWLIPIALFIDSFTYDATAQCTSDPPAWPTWTSDDLLAIPGGVLNPNFQTLLAKVKQQLLVWLWPQYCQCTGGTTPSIGAPNGPPSGYAVSTGAQAGSCFNVTAGHTFSAQGYQLLTNANNITTQFLPSVPGTVTSNDGFGDIFTAYKMPAGITGVQWVGTSLGNGIHPNDDVGILQLVYCDSSGNNIQNIQFQNDNGLAPVHSTQGFRATPAGAVYWALFYRNSYNEASTVTGSIQDQITFFCGSNPGALVVPCTTDPALLALVQEIWNEVQLILQSLPTTLTSYAESTSHSGLTGGGTILLGSSTIAVKVSITTDNPVYPSAPGDPTYLFDRGYIVPIAVEGPIRAQTRLVYNPQVFQLPPLADSVGYYFNSGVTATILELTRGP